jgi:Dirigent-like protein
MHMPKRALVAGLVGIAVVGAVGVAAAMGGSSSRPALRPWGFGAGRATPVGVSHLTQARTITLHASAFVTAAIDNDPAGTSQGDEIVVSGTLNQRGIDQPVGRIQVTETFTELPAGGGAHLLLTFTATLPAGQITSSGVGRVSRSGVITIKIPVVGGTGKYRNARGVVVVTPSTNTARLTFFLIP